MVFACIEEGKIDLMDKKLNMHEGLIRQVNLTLNYYCGKGQNDATGSYGRTG